MNETNSAAIFSKVTSLLLCIFCVLLLLLSPLVAWVDGTLQEGVEDILLFGALSFLFYATYKQYSIGYLSLIVLSIWLFAFRNPPAYFLVIPAIVLLPFVQGTLKKLTDLAE